MDRQSLLSTAFVGVFLAGILMAAGINISCTGNGGAPKSNYDAVVADLNDIASRAQKWYTETRSLGGAAKFSDFTLDKIKFQSSNKNGTYSINGMENMISFTVQGVGKEDTDNDGKPVTINMTVFPDSTSMQVISK